MLSCLALGVPFAAATPNQAREGAGPAAEWAPTPVARPGTTLAAREAMSKSRLRRTLARQMRRVGGGSGAWVGRLTARGARGVFADSGSKRRIIASNSKLFATAAFLDRFGAEGELTTRVFARGKRRGTGERVLSGNLYLVGDGDPALGKSGIGRLARAVQAAGIRKVAGGIRADDSIFDRRRSVPQPGITGGPFLTTLSGLSFEQGRGPGDPARAAAEELRRKLKRRGIRVRGGIKVADAPANVLNGDPLGGSASPRAQSLIAQTNTPSDNFYAEMLLKRLAANGRRQGTTKRGARLARRFARGLGSEVRLDNGSGLSRRNIASPKSVARLLAGVAASSSNSAPFAQSLAVAGRTGTLASRMRGTAAEGRCRAKTGTLDGVSALSGYCGRGPKRRVFSILMNGVNLDTARNAQDAMVAAIARYRP